MSEEKQIKDIVEILELSKEEIENNNENITATLDLQDLKSLNNLYDLYIKERDLNNELQIRYKIENDKYNKEKEKNKKLEDKIKKAIKEIERRMNLANECIEQEIVIADSDSLNYGRAQAHDVDSVLLKEILE